MNTLYPSTGEEPRAQVEAIVASIKDHLANALHDDFPRRYLPTIHRWYNCREQGYIVTAKINQGLDNYKAPLQILFYEHRNSDIVCIWDWEEAYFYPPCTWGEVNAKTTHLTSKWDYPHHVSYGEFEEAGLWIVRRLVEYYTASLPKELFYEDYLPI